jgi:hypothetical protein
MHDVHAKNLFAQVEQLKEEAAISQSRICAAEQQAWDARAQMQREQFQTAEMIAQLQDQNQMLQGQLLSIQATAASEATVAQLQHQVQLLQGQLLSAQATADEERVRVIAAAEREAQCQEELKREAEGCSRLRARVQQLKIAISNEGNKAAQAALRSKVTFLKLSAQMKCVSQAETGRMQCRIAELEAVAQNQSGQLAAVQGENWRLHEVLRELVLERSHHEAITVEQVRQGVAVQRCGS